MAERLGAYGVWYRNAYTHFGDKYATDRVPTQSGMLSVPHRKGRDGKYREGGPWHAWRTTVEMNRQDVSTTLTNYYRYLGDMRFQDANPSTLGLSTALSFAGGSSWEGGNLNAATTSLEAYGAKAYNMLRPDLPTFDAALNLLELKDVPKMLKQSIEAAQYTMNMYKLAKTPSKYQFVDANGVTRRVGEYSLMTMFGYLPLVASVLDFYQAFITLDESLNKVVSRASRPYRVRRQIFTDTVVESFSYFVPSTATTMVAPVDTHSSIKPPGTYSGVGTAYVRVWAEGRFRIMLPRCPNGDVDMRKLRRRMLGSRVTLSTLYNLMPWSWLADYFTDLGQFVKAVSPGVADRVYTDYFYIMRHVEHSVDETYDGTNPTKGVSIKLTKKTRRVLKMRRAASPFGFGVLTSSLTPKQLAILGALGLSRL